MTRPSTRTVAFALAALAMSAGHALSAGRAALAGSSWVVRAIDGASVGAPRPPTMAFDGKGRVSGWSGCNRFFGAYKARDGRISFSQLGATQMACAGPGAEVEGRFLQALGQVRRYAAEGGGLTLKRDDNSPALELSRGGAR